MTTLLWLATGLWAVMLLLPWRPWSSRPSLESSPQQAPQTDFSNTITVLIPARNESDTLPKTLKALNNQGNNFRIIVIDDRSEDDTAKIARSFDTGNLTVISGAERPGDWIGKPWALEQGRRLIKSELTLLLDADIELQPGILSAAIEFMDEQHIPFISLMTQPRMQGFWEKLLMPAFVYFFKLVYPFSISNSSSRRVSAACGEFILLRTEILEEIGGFSSIKDALIDDCTLAREVKKAGFRTWTGLTRSANSLRDNEKFADIYSMVARNAFTQLRYSSVLLLICTLLMLLMYALPVIGLFTVQPVYALPAVIALFCMSLSYLPILRYYGRSPVLALTLPLIGALYLAMTWGSALRYWRGTRSQWKGRTYRTDTQV